MGPTITHSSFQTTRRRAQRLPACVGNDEFSEEIRQTVVSRYRVLFTIKGRRVHVLHVRGAYVGGD